MLLNYWDGWVLGQVVLAGAKELIFQNFQDGGEFNYLEK